MSYPQTCGLCGQPITWWSSPTSPQVLARDGGTKFPGPLHVQTCPGPPKAEDER